MTYSLWADAASPGGAEASAGSGSVGLEFYVTQDAWCYGIWYWRTANMAGPWPARLYQVVSSSSGNLLNSVSIPDNVQAGTWQYGAFSSPVRLTAGTRYRVSVDRNNSYYAKTSRYWISGGAGSGGLSNGPLVFPDAPNATGGMQCPYGDPGGYPSSYSGSGNNYWSDVEVSLSAPTHLVLDSSSPIPNNSNNNTQSVTLSSASFTPPAGSVIIVTYDTSDSGSGDWDASGSYPTITDSLATHLTWNLVAVVYSNALSVQSHRMGVLWAYAGNVSPGRMTVSITDSVVAGRTIIGGTVAVKVWDNANTSNPIGAVVTSNATAATSALSVSITPQAIGSALMLAACCDGVATASGGSGDYVIDTSGQHFIQEWIGDSSGPALTSTAPQSSGSAVFMSMATQNLTASCTTAEPWQYIAYEVKAAASLAPQLAGSAALSGTGALTAVGAHAGGLSLSAALSGSGTLTAAGKDTSSSGKYSIWADAASPGGAPASSGSGSVGVEFYVTQDAWCYGIWYWRTANMAGPWPARLYQVVSSSSGNLLNSVSIPDNGQGGTWQYGAFSSPVKLTASTRYKTAVDRSNSNYAKTSGYWISGGAGSGGLSNGPLIFPDASNATGGQQGTYGDVGGYPDGYSGSGNNYWSDVEVSLSAPTRLVLDSSSPIPDNSNNNTQSVTLPSASFTPPAGSVIIVTYDSADSGSGDWDASGSYPTITDSLATHLTWNKVAVVYSNAVSVPSHRMGVWWAYAGKVSPGRMTVSITDSVVAGRTIIGGTVAVKVWDNANTSNPIGAVVTSNATAATSALSVSITPQALGSALLLAACCDGSTTASGGSGDYVIDTSGEHFIQEWIGSSSGPALTTSLATQNLTASCTGGSTPWQYIAYEVKVSSG